MHVGPRTSLAFHHSQAVSINPLSMDGSTTVRFKWTRTRPSKCNATRLCRFPLPIRISGLLAVLGTHEGLQCQMHQVFLVRQARCLSILCGEDG
jgi:hypothetical protein